MIELFATLALLAAGALGGYVIVEGLRGLKARKEWREYAQARGLPLCRRCQLPEDHYDHTTGGHMFEDP